MMFKVRYLNGVIFQFKIYWLQRNYFYLFFNINSLIIAAQIRICYYNWKFLHANIKFNWLIVVIKSVPIFLIFLPRTYPRNHTNILPHLKDISPLILLSLAYVIRYSLIVFLQSPHLPFAIRFISVDVREGISYFQAFI